MIKNICISAEEISKNDKWEKKQTHVRWDHNIILNRYNDMPTLRDFHLHEYQGHYLLVRGFISKYAIKKEKQTDSRVESCTIESSVFLLSGINEKGH